ncbi:ABC transporter permease [Mesomycoplasma conjunctivae]|uniref:ABC transporter permease n=1 Tax=Mesomycoplasma conjunctivae TaxID=45361 RepID=UPI003DA298F8
MSSNFLTKFKKFHFGYTQKTAIQKVYSSLWAIFFGLILSSIFIGSFGYNPFLVFKQMIFDIAFSPFQQRNFVLTLVVFLVASVGVGVAFKAGLFNIGIPGQMMISGLFSLLIMFNLKNLSVHSRLFLGAIIGISSSAMIGTLVGILKVYFRTNEVISTILINWIIYYISKFFIEIKSDKFEFFNNSSPNTSISINDPAFSSSFYNTSGFAILILVLIIIAILGIWFVVEKTNIGLKIKIIGQNKNVALYSGISEKKVIIYTMAFSGMLAGVGGFLWYVFNKQNMFLDSGPLPEGFNTILVSLLAFNSPIGIIFSSLFYSIIYFGSSSLQVFGYSGLDSQTSQVFVGLIIYLSAISTIFLDFKPIAKLKELLILWKTKRYFGKHSIKKLDQLLKQQKLVKPINLHEKQEFLTKKLTHYINDFDENSSSILAKYIKIQIWQIQLYFVEKKIAKSNISNLKDKWKIIKKDIKNNFSLVLNKNSTTDEKLQYFEKLALHRRESNQKLKDLGYYDLKNNFNLHKQKIAENRRNFLSIRAKLIKENANFSCSFKDKIIKKFKTRKDL